MLVLFLQNCQSLQAPPVLSAPPSFNSESLHGHLLTFDPVMTTLSNLKGLLQTVCQEGFVSVYERGKRLPLKLWLCSDANCQLCCKLCVSVAVRDVVIINPAVQLHTTQSGDNHAAGQTEAALGESVYHFSVNVNTFSLRAVNKPTDYRTLDYFCSKKSLQN